MTEAVVLASASPTRSRLLAAAGVDFGQQPARLDEAVVKRAFRSNGAAAADCALALAEAKAMEVAARWPAALVIGADQILDCDGRWLDKPVRIEHARIQLQLLRGLTHELVTAVCAIEHGARVWHAVRSAKLSMRRFSDTFLESYLASEGTTVLGSVGAYRLEGRGIQLFARIEGDYFAILGLPLFELMQFLRERQVLVS
jgi:septum formation protein